MRVHDVMKKDVVSLPADETFGGAYRKLLTLRIRSLPVVNEKGIYQGMFDVRDLWEVLLPKAATLAGDSLPDLSFLAGSQQQLRDKLAEADSRPVREFLKNRAAPAVPSDAPVHEAILLLYRHEGNLPVIDRRTGALVGIVSDWEILAAL